LSNPKRPQLDRKILAIHHHVVLELNADPKETVPPANAQLTMWGILIVDADQNVSKTRIVRATKAAPTTDALIHAQVSVD
jgi:hypothetical protein